MGNADADTTMMATIEFKGTMRLDAEACPVPGAGASAFAEVIERTAHARGIEMTCESIAAITVSTRRVDAAGDPPGAAGWDQARYDADGTPVDKVRYAVDAINTSGGVKYRLTTNVDGEATVVGVFPIADDAFGVGQAWQDGALRLIGTRGSVTRAWASN